MPVPDARQHCDYRQRAAQHILAAPLRQPTAIIALSAADHALAARDRRPETSHRLTLTSTRQTLGRPGVRPLGPSPVRCSGMGDGGAVGVLGAALPDGGAPEGGMWYDCHNRQRWEPL